MVNTRLPNSIQAAYDTLDHVFYKYFNSKANQANKFPAGDPRRVEPDISDLEKAHIELFQSQLNATIAKELLRAMAESSEKSGKLARKVFWLNVVVAILTVVLASSALLELAQ